MTPRVQSTLVKVIGNNQNHSECTALVDSCSVINFVTVDLVKKLGLPTCKGDLAVATMNGMSEFVAERVELTIQSVSGDHRCAALAWVVPSLPVGPSHIFSRDDLEGWAHLRDISYEALPRSGIEPSLLLGTDCVSAFRML